MVDIRKLYRYCRRRQVLPKGVDELKACLSALNALMTQKWSVQTHTIQRFRNIEGYRVTVEGQVAFFPKSLDEVPAPSGLGRMRQAFLSLDLVLPPYFAMGFLSPMGARAEKLQSTQERDALAEQLFAQMYDHHGIASLCIGVYKTNKAVAPYYEYILESVKAYYAGLYRASILTLIPCVEGAIRNIGTQLSKQTSSDISKEFLIDTLSAVQKRYIRSIVYAGYDWVPEEAMGISAFDKFDEAIQIIESVKFFLERSLYQHTSRYSSTVGLNRHGIVHGLISDFHNPSNFWRLITLINSLSVASIFAGHNASLLFPPRTTESEALALTFDVMRKLLRSASVGTRPARRLMDVNHSRENRARKSLTICVSRHHAYLQSQRLSPVAPYSHRYLHVCARRTDRREGCC